MLPSLPPKRRDGILKEMGQHRQISIDNANVAHEISEEIAAKDGPLMQEVKLLYDRLRLERKVWHSKTFNGNDLDKLYHVDIIAELVSIFSPRLVWAEQLDA